MSRIVFLLEERSMKTLLDGMLPRLFPEIKFICIPHEGKQDLEKSIPRKLKAWREPGVRFMVVRDNDGGDCQLLKSRLVTICKARQNDVLVRIACQELEAWYFGEPAAIAGAFTDENLNEIGNKSRYRDPDSIQQPCREMAKLVPQFQKVSGARRMALYLSRNGNRSRSFQVMLAGIERLYAGIQEENAQRMRKDGRQG